MKTLVLDFDGTIADTESSIIQTIQATARQLALPHAAAADIKRLIGLPLKNTLTQALGITNEEVLSKAVALYRSTYNEVSLHTVALFPNVKQTLEHVYAKSIHITVASSKGKDALVALLQRLGISQYITLIMGEQDVAHKKPAPDMVLRIMEATKSAPKETLVVGDTVYDIEMGQRAGCTTCGVTYGNHTKQQLQEQKADFIIGDFSELIGILNL